MRILSNLLKHTGVQNQLMRCISEQRFVDSTVGDNRIAILTMQRPPVNSMNLQLLQEMGEHLDHLEKEKVKGVILTSAMPNVFAAGLDIMEIYKADIKRFELFWSTLQDLWLKLFGSSFVTAAAINGHAPAGGCLLSLSCEYRVMVRGNYTIGLNEAALGIIATPWIQASMSHAINSKNTERALTTARLFTVEEASEIGLIDETASDKQDAVKKCKLFIRKFDKIPYEARVLTKLQMRDPLLRKLRENRQEDLDLIIGIIKNPDVQRDLEVYLAGLKQKKIVTQ